MDRFVYAIEGLNVWVGRAFGWCILILTLSVSYEVFVRYVLNAPTVWSMDMMIQMYGALFLMAGHTHSPGRTSGETLYRLLSLKHKENRPGTVRLVLLPELLCFGTAQRSRPTAGDIKRWLEQSGPDTDLLL